MTNWNHAFTSLIRGSRPAYWGNWGLNMQIKPGAVGILDPGSGDFRIVVDELPGLKEPRKTPISGKWRLMSEHVSRKESNIKVDGSGTDTESGTKIKADLEVKWQFGKQGAFTSEFSLSHESTIDDFGEIISKNIDFLTKKAESVSMGHGGKIAQGFGVVTGVLWANSGLNLGSLAARNNFSICGSASGLKEMLGGVTGKGSYVSTNYDMSLDQHVWPERGGIQSPGPVPIAYTFASFDGQMLIPNWIKELGSFELVLINKVGCTYITDIKFTYETPAGTIRKNLSISGGLTSIIGDIPLNAKNLKLSVSFICGRNSHFNFHWDDPLGQWINGQRHIEMDGLWPGKPSCIERQ